MAGRIGRGEIWQFDEFSSETSLRVNGRPIYLDRFRLLPGENRPDREWMMGNARYLATGVLRHDHTAQAAAELTVLFGLLTLVSGPLWARRAWGTWWVWDARLTSSLVGWMIGWAYLILRRYGGPGSDKLAAGVALFGAVNVPFIFISVNYWRTIHPPTTIVPRLPVDMGVPLWFCVFAFLLLFILLMTMRLRLEVARTRLDALYVALDE